MLSTSVSCGINKFEFPVDFQPYKNNDLTGFSVALTNDALVYGSPFYNSSGKASFVCVDSTTLNSCTAPVTAETSDEDEDLTPIEIGAIAISASVVVAGAAFYGYRMWLGKRISAKLSDITILL